MSSHSRGCAKLAPPPPALLPRRRRRRPHNPTWLRGRARPQHAGRGGARRKRAAAGPAPASAPAPGGTTPSAAGLAAPARGPAPFRQRRRLRGGPGAAAPARDPPAVSSPDARVRRLPPGEQRRRVSPAEPRALSARVHLCGACARTQTAPPGLPGVALISGARRAAAPSAVGEATRPRAARGVRREPQVPGSPLRPGSALGEEGQTALAQACEGSLLPDASNPNALGRDLCRALRRVNVFVTINSSSCFKDPEHVFFPPSCELENIPFSLLVFWFVLNLEVLVFLLSKMIVPVLECHTEK